MKKVLLMCLMGLVFEVSTRPPNRKARAANIARQDRLKLQESRQDNYKPHLTWKEHAVRGAQGVALAHAMYLVASWGK